MRGLRPLILFLTTAALLSTAACWSATKPSPSTVVVLRGERGVDYSDAQMTASAAILRERMADVGFAGSHVSLDGGTVTVTLAGKIDTATVQRLIAPGELQFRLVKQVKTVSGCTPDPNAASATTAITACGTGDDAEQQFSLAPAVLTGGDVGSAAGDSGDACQYWCISLSFKPEAQARWIALTKQAVGLTASTGQPTQVAIVHDGVVITAPEIQSVIVGPADIAQLTEADAKAILTDLKHGPLPVTFAIASITNVHG